MRRAIAALISTAAIMLVAGVPAYAYQESSTSVDPGDTPANSCPTCHGLESSTQASDTVAPGRKGPHGGYTTGTNKCSTCHSVHSAESPLLLPAASVRATCETCHDGTGGGGVYGVIARRLPDAEVHGHEIGVASGGAVTVPGGNADGGDSSTSFSAENGGLTCTDCHSPHDGNTVQAFLGDRKRSSDDSSVVSVKSNRLLRKRPTSATEDVSVYGSEWCASCHKGALRGSMTHPVATTETTFSAHYDSVQRLAAYDTSEVAPAKGPLGGANLGYVVPDSSAGLPICQQCHEDARDIANDPENHPMEVSSTTESFTAPVDGITEGNPRFQNFPHETTNSSILIETNDSLCLNCHASSFVADGD